MQEYFHAAHTADIQLLVVFIIIFKRSVSQSAPVLYIVIQDVKRHL